MRHFLPSKLHANSVNSFVYLCGESYDNLAVFCTLSMSFLNVFLQCGFCEVVFPGNAEDEPRCNECSLQTHN